MRDQVMPTVSIILVNYNGAEVARNCLASLKQHLKALPYEVIVVDNASTDRSAGILADALAELQLPGQLILAPKNRGFGAGNNLAAAQAKGEYLLLLNTDTEIASDILPPLVDWLHRDAAIAIVGPQLRNPDGSFQISTSPAISLQGEAAAVRILRQYERDPASVEQQFAQPQAIDIVVGAAMLMRRSQFLELGGFDENFFMYFEESDLCQRARDRGWRVWYTPEVRVMHIKGASTQQQPSPMMLEYRRSQLRYYQKHRPPWEQFVVRIYLGLKFGLLWGRSRQPVYWEIMQLALQPHLNSKP